MDGHRLLRIHFDIQETIGSFSDFRNPVLRFETQSLLK